MSVENLKEYARRCTAEPELRAKAKEIGLSDMDEHMRHAESLGLDWTLDDMIAFRKEVIEAEGELEDLSQEDLEQVAAGVITATAIAAGAAVAVGLGAVGVGIAVAAHDGSW